MSYGILKYRLPDEHEEWQTACRAGAMACAIEQIRNEVFRPARKHGYSDSRIAALLVELPEGKGEELIGILEEMFYNILNENGVNE